MPIEIFSISFESTQNKQQYGIKMYLKNSYTELKFDLKIGEGVVVFVGGGGGGGGGGARSIQSPFLNVSTTDMPDTFQQF